MTLFRFRSLRWISIICLILLLGCQSMDTGNREARQISNKRITVLDNPEITTYEESTVDALTRLDNVRGMDWLSEDELIVDRENTSFTPEKADGEKWYPHNLYIHSLLSGEQTALIPENRNQGYAQISPDRSKLFYKTFDLQASTGQAYLMDIATRRSFAVTDKDALDIQNGRWVDNSSIIYATIEGKIFLANLADPIPKMLLETQNPFVSNVAYMDDKLYYTNLDGNLLTSPIKKKPTYSMISNVLSMVPSPDEQRLAIVRRIKSGGVELVITDLQGSIQTAIAQDTQIYGAAWSPDGKRLAYASYNSNGIVRGIYVADSTTGLSTPLPLDIKFIADPLHWSPTGSRLMISATQPDDTKRRNEFVTYLARVSEQVVSADEKEAITK